MNTEIKIYADYVFNKSIMDVRSNIFLGTPTD